jgi:hypothetical protein
VMLAGAGAWGLGLTLFGAMSNAWAGLGCLVFAGAADTVTVVSRSTVVQLNTPDPLLGRVVAAEQVVGQAGPALGNLRAGLVASWTSPAAALVSGGLTCMAVVALVALTTPQLRNTAASAIGTPD